LDTGNNLALIVDSDPVHQEILECMLEDEMTVLCVYSASECLEMVKFKSPCVVVLERNLPDMDGYELCKKLKILSQGSSSFAIIILTETSSYEDKMLGYQSGCTDFLAKPFQPEELLHKIHLSIEVHAIQHDLKDQAKESSDTAMSAMKMCSDMGQILQFMEQCIQCNNYQELANLIIKTLSSFGVDSCLAINTLEGHIFYGCEANSPQENVLAMCHDKGSLIEMGPQLIVNSGAISALINNMPIENEVRNGELKDVLHIILKSTSAQIENLKAIEVLAKQQSGELNKAIVRSFDQIKTIKTSLSHQYYDMCRILDSLSSELREACMIMGLTETQEEDMLSMIDNFVGQVKSTHDNTNNIEQQVVNVVSDLTKLLRTNID